MNNATTPSEVFPKRLRQAREMRGLSQSELAKRAKLDPSAVSHFETGGRKPSFANLRRLADALDVTTDYLLGRTEAPEVFQETDDALFRDFERLTAEDRDFARDFMATLSRKSSKKRN